MGKKEKGFIRTSELEKRMEEDTKFFNKLVEELRRECMERKINAEISQDAQHLIVKTEGRESHIRKGKTVPPTGINIRDYIKDYLGIPIEEEEED